MWSPNGQGDVLTLTLTLTFDLDFICFVFWSLTGWERPQRLSSESEAQAPSPAASVRTLHACRIE
jgi:hypothetical protein